MCSANLHHLLHLRIHQSLTSFSSRSPIYSSISRSGFIVKLSHGSAIRRRLQRSALRPIAAMDDDFMDVSLGFDEVDEGLGADSYYMMYSSGDESDVDIAVNPAGDYEVPLSKEHRLETPEGALNLTLHRFGAIQRGHKKRKSQG